MSAQDILERDAYERDPTLFWLWPERWLETPINKATQKFEAFWRFIPRARDWIRVKSDGLSDWGLGFRGEPNEVRVYDRGSIEFARVPSAPCGAKTTFKTLNEAAHAAPGLTAYRCPRCRGVHVTMQPKETWGSRDLTSFGGWGLLSG